MFDDLAVVGIFRVLRMLYLICDLSGSMVFSPWYEPISNHDIIHKWRSWMKIISSHHPGIDDENYLTMKILKLRWSCIYWHARYDWWTKFQTWMLMSRSNRSEKIQSTKRKDIFDLSMLILCLQRNYNAKFHYEIILI